MRVGIEILLKPLTYLDPGSGSFIIQMILAGSLGIAIAIKIYWKKIVALFRKGKGGDVQDELDEMDEYGESLNQKTGEEE